MARTRDDAQVWLFLISCIRFIISGFRAKANPLVVEGVKDARERGYYMHPQLYGASKEKQIDWDWDR